MVRIKLEPIRTFALTLSVAATLGGTAMAQDGDRLSRSCIQEIRQLCGSDRSQIRSCLRERFSDLSQACGKELRERIRQRRQSDGRMTQPEPPAQASETLAYGDHPRQRIDIYLPDNPDGVKTDPAPVVLFIHGGGWRMGDHRTTVQSKPEHFNRNDYVFASTGYRLLPETPVEDQARDIGAAVRAVAMQGESNGIDPSRIVLMGHSAGAHLAALVASDPQYAGAAFDTVRGVILLDGAGYDVTTHMTAVGNRARAIYTDAFGTDPQRQAALSPLTHVGGRDAPHWLALYVAGREASKGQSEMLATALDKAGVNAQAMPISDTDHRGMNRAMGTARGAAQTQAVDAFLAQVFAG